MLPNKVKSCSTCSPLLKLQWPSKYRIVSSCAVHGACILVVGLFANSYAEYNKTPLDDQGNRDGQRQCRDLLNKVHNALQRDVELSFQTVTAALGGFPERYRSHEFHNLIMAPFLTLISESDSIQDSQKTQQDIARDSTSGDSLLISEVNGRVTLSNQRMDYAMRPDCLEACSLYDFVGYWEKKPLGSSRTYCEWAEEDIERSMEADWDSPMHSDDRQQFRFAPGHNQFDTHGLCFRFDHQQHVVVLKGPSVPSRAKEPVRFAQLILLLFKPFRNITDLRASDSWENALHDFELAASKRVRFYISNIEELRIRQVAWEEDVVLKDTNQNQKERDDVDFESDEDKDDPEGTTDSVGADAEEEEENKDCNSLVWMQYSDKISQAYKNAKAKGLFAQCAEDSVTAVNPRNGQDTRSEQSEGWHLVLEAIA